MAVINPFDFFVEPYAETFPFAYPAELREELAPYLDDGAGRPAALRHSSPRCRASRAEHRRFPGRAQSAPAARDPLSDPHGAGRADAGGDARGGVRLLPRQRVAAGADAAPSRSRRALRVRLSHPAEARPASRSTGPPAPTPRFHRSARLGRGLSAGRRLDRARPDLGPACAARAICRSPRRRTTAPPRRSPARSSRPRSTFSFDMKVTRIAEKPRVTCRSPTKPGPRSMRSATRSMRISLAHDVRLTMGGEPTFVSIDDYRVGGMEHRRARPDQAHPRRRTDPPPARPLRAGRPPALRPGQMVSGRAAAALGVRAVSGATTASRSGATRR